MSIALTRRTFAVVWLAVCLGCAVDRGGVGVELPAVDGGLPAQPPRPDAGMGSPDVASSSVDASPNLDARVSSPDTAAGDSRAPDAPRPDATVTPDLPADRPPPVTMMLRFQQGVAPTSAYAGAWDTALAQQNPNQNREGRISVSVDGDDPAGSQQDSVVLLRWDLSIIPRGARVSRVELHLTVTDASTDSYPVYELQRAWNPAQATWNMARAGEPWGAPGAAAAGDRGATRLGTVGPAMMGPHTVALNDVGVAAVQRWVDDPTTNFGAIVAADSGSNGLDFATADAISQDNRPKLVVSFTVP